MNETMVIGYCGWCAHNTEHGLYRKTALSGLGDGVRRLLSGQRGFGPWYCAECRRVENYLVAPMESYTVSSVSSPQRAVKCADGAEDVTVHRSRFTAKFRAAFAKRIIEGRQSFKQVSDQLEVPKPEIWTWVVELFDNQQKRIAELTRSVESLEQALTKVDGLNSKERLEVAKFRQQWTTITVSSDMSLNGSPSRRINGL